MHRIESLLLLTPFFFTSCDDTFVDFNFQLACKRVLQARRVEYSEERGEPPLAIGLQRLHQISDRKREHDPVDGMGDTLRNLDVPFIGRDACPVYCRYLFANNARDRW